MCVCVVCSVHAYDSCASVLFCAWACYMRMKGSNVKEYGLQVSVLRHHSGPNLHSLTGSCYDSAS